MKDIEGAVGKRDPSLRHLKSENLSTNKGKSTDEVRKTRVAHHTLNTISGGFFGGDETSSARKRYARSVMHVFKKLFSKEKGRHVAIIFLRWDSEGILVHENDPKVIKLQNHDWSIKRVLIYPSSFSYILYREAFKGMNMDTSELLPFKGTLVVFSREHVQVLGHLPIMTIFGSEDNAKGIKDNR